ncbi:MAG: malto-oligosyltrehalose synthase, partial [Calditrichaceae bacterium]
LSNLPLATATDLPSVKQRHRDKEVLQQMLVRLDKNNPEVSTAISDVVNKINSDPDAFDELAGQQNYRLAFWRMAERDLGYRRFFDINDLIGLRVEDLQVFEDTHRLLFSLIEFDKAAGMRIDHPDGLRNPEYYFQNLKQACPNAWILAEKILEQDETLRDSWAVDGTTGYDFLNRLNGLFINPDNENKITDLYVNFTGESPDFKNLVYEKKMQVMREILGSDVNRLTGLLLDICERHRRYRDYTRYQLQQGLMQIAACFPVYRTYIRAGIGKIADEDIRYIKHAVAAAKEQNEELAGDVFDFIGALLLLQIRGELENEFVMQFQQFTAPVMAKGVEDTAFYCYNRLTSLNEVGGFPDRFGISVREFHQSCINTQKNWPGTLLASSTHDTKRSEDVRARLNLLSEIPDQWENAVRHWSKLNDRYHKNNYPDRNAEYLLYQTMTGAWPVSEERILAYMEKASREAKVYTSWTRPDKDYDAALKSFILSVYKNDDFINSLENFVSLLSRPGWINALSQTLVKLTAPGVPDIYQGTEVWNYSLVDPDNRRPVDFNLLKEKLNALKYIQPDKIVESMDDGLAKLWVIKKTLNLRAKHPEYFGLKASYTPVEASGPKSDHVFAFMREEKAVTIVPRLIMSLNNDWQDTKIKIPSGNWVNELTGEKLKGGDILLSQLLFHFPVSLLSKEMTNK